MSEHFDNLILSTYADLCVLWRMEVVSCRSNAKDINSKLLSLESVINAFGLGLPGLAPRAAEGSQVEDVEITNAQAISKAQAFGEAQALAESEVASKNEADEQPAVDESEELAPRALKPVPRPAIPEAEPGLKEGELVARPAKAEFANV